ncbi:hypothetical protein JST56_07175 [Candidatus Dependentiae bacterium]|nr:hypothetical protein [Candidatus Dependentiae bacterium]
MPIELTHDGSIDIATGRSRKELHWKNKETLWSELIDKLSTTHYTAETHAEYVASKKQRQDEIKDIGGFVGGYLSSGRRKQGNVLHRQLVTLDIDFARPGIWDDFMLLYDCAAVVYSTHKHTSVNPRLRLILPLDRAVQPDEYVAISRRIAGDLGIEYFDHTTFEPSRLMYWPSTSKDGEYFFEYQDGPWISADALLKTYHNWRDSSEWPVSEKYNTIIQNAIKKQGDPLEKSGVIGAFCRTYSIEEAIETFLADEYTPCAVEGRYTYKHGSTSAGLVIYEHKYAYSHHGTDPVSGKLCNSFDLVRLHKYGLKDEDAREGTPGNKLPSYTAMVEFAAKDPEVRKLLGAERLAEAHQDFITVEDETEEPVSDEWLAKLDVDKKGNFRSTINNIVLILENDGVLKGKLALNTFEQREVFLKNLPWRKITPVTKYMTDKDDAGIRHYIETAYSVSGIQKVKDAIDMVMMRNSFHPVRDYLDGLQWDGLHRLDTLLIDYLGADSSDYVKAVTRKALVAAVARIYKPGIKYDYVLTLVGKQGIGKSSIIKKLGKDWYSDSFGSIQGKEAFEQIQGVWLVEIGELAGLRKADLETVKHFISKQEDRYRVAYGRRIENFPRQCVFFATTNNRDFLRDPTGNRRFWPVDTLVQEPVKNVFTDLTPKEVSQLWAEAVALYKAGEPLFLDEKLEAEAFSIQQDHSEKDERVGAIQRYLDMLVPDNWEDMTLYERRAFMAGDDLQAEGIRMRGQVCVAEIWCELLRGDSKDMTVNNTKYIHEIMQNMEGWARAKSNRRFKFYGPQRAYYRVENQDEKVPK